MKGSAQLALGTVSTVLALAVGFAVAVTLAGCAPGVTVKSAGSGLVATVEADLAATPPKTLAQIEADVAADLNLDVSPAVEAVLDVVLGVIEVADRVALGDKALAVHQQLGAKMAAEAGPHGSIMQGWPTAPPVKAFSR